MDFLTAFAFVSQGLWLLTAGDLAAYCAGSERTMVGDHCLEYFSDELPSWTESRTQCSLDAPIGTIGRLLHATTKEKADGMYSISGTVRGFVGAKLVPPGDRLVQTDYGWYINDVVEAMVDPPALWPPTGYSLNMASAGTRECMAFIPDLIRFQNIICTSSFDVNECNSSPCQNSGTCVNGDNQYTCTCPAGVTGGNCESVETAGISKREPDAVCGFMCWD